MTAGKDRHNFPNHKPTETMKELTTHPNLPLAIALASGIFLGGIGGFFAASLWLAGEAARIERRTWRAAMNYYKTKRAQEERNHHV
jgi:hypothetical protein